MPFLLRTATIPTGMDEWKRHYQRDGVTTGVYDDAMYEFVLAVDAEKRRRGVAFLPASQVFQVVLALGYRRSAEPVPLAKKREKTPVLRKEPVPAVRPATPRKRRASDMRPAYKCDHPRQPTPNEMLLARARALQELRENSQKTTTK